MPTKARCAARTLWFVTLTVATAMPQTSVPAVVVDGSGQTVHGLQKSDFDVRCGKSASFESVEEVSPLKFANFADPVPVFILFDSFSIQKPRQSEAEQWLLSYLRKAADEHLAVTLMETTTNGIRVIHDMSTDSRVFSAAMDRVSPKGGPAPSPVSGLPEALTKAVDEEAAQLQTLTQPMPTLSPDNYMKLMSLQLESLRMVGKMLQRSPKRKPLVWITGSFPALVGKGGGELVINYAYQSYPGYLPETRSEAVSALDAVYESAIDSLNDARVSLYPLAVQKPVPTSGLTNVESKGPQSSMAEAIMARSGRGNQYTSGQGLQDLATSTGGNVLIGPDGAGSREFVMTTAGKVLTGAPRNEDFPSAMADLERHFDSYYLLKFTLQPTRKTTWVESSVKVTKPNTEVAAAKGFFSSHE